MKICWDNLENIRLSKNGNFRDYTKKKTYHLKICKNCNEEFLSLMRKGNTFCCISCNSSYNNRGKRHPLYGKHHSEETKKKMSEVQKGEKGNMYGKHRSEETKRKIGEALKGEKNYKWNGGYRGKGIPIYSTYAPQIDWCEDVRRNKKDTNILEVKCSKCGEWYVPTLSNIFNRIQALKNNPNYRGEHRFYCSSQCKNSCYLYGKSPESLMRKDAVRSGRLPWIELTREVQPELRKMVLERDDHKCVKCGETENVQCHHIYPVNIEPLLSADIDNCITLYLP